MSKKEKLTDEELLAQFDSLEGDGTAIQAPKRATGGQQSDADLFEELGIPERPKPNSCPHTPRPQSTWTTLAARSSPKLTRVVTPSSTDDARSSEEEKARQRKSGDSTRSLHKSFTPASSGEGETETEPEKSASVVPEAVQSQSSGGGWWGSVFSTASAAVKQAEALAKEIRQNEEAQRWAEQVKGNVGALRGLGTLFIGPSSYCFDVDIDPRR